MGINATPSPVATKIRVGSLCPKSIQQFTASFLTLQNAFLNTFAIAISF